MELTANTSQKQHQLKEQQPRTTALKIKAVLKALTNKSLKPGRGHLRARSCNIAARTGLSRRYA